MWPEGIRARRAHVARGHPCAAESDRAVNCVADACSEAPTLPQSYACVRRAREEAMRSCEDMTRILLQPEKRHKRMGLWTQCDAALCARARGIEEAAEARKAARVHRDSGEAVAILFTCFSASGCSLAIEIKGQRRGPRRRATRRNRARDKERDRESERESKRERKGERQKYTRQRRERPGARE